MRTAYQVQLGVVNEDLVELTRLVGSAMDRATRALLDADLALAEQVMAGDAAVDDLSVKVEDDCYLVVARHQPVATDLRSVVASLRMSASLERMGDLAVLVARATRNNYPDSAVPALLRPVFQEMGAVAEIAVARAGAVIATQDLALAAEISAADESMHGLHRDLLQTVLGEHWDLGVEAAVRVSLLARFYERYADHAFTIAKRVLHVATGEPYRSLDAADMAAAAVDARPPGAADGLATRIFQD